MNQSKPKVLQPAWWLPFSPAEQEILEILERGPAKAAAIKQELSGCPKSYRLSVLLPNLLARRVIRRGADGYELHTFPG
ncbi:MAG: hypothetical protein EXR99_10400 [Gemmataceae bacterium]|nr:hypothetical protein [Gemmataceae bacterium]